MMRICVRVTCPFLSVWKPFKRVWPQTKLLVLMAYRPNFTCRSGLYLVLIWFMSWTMLFNLVFYLSASGVVRLIWSLRLMIIPCSKLGVLSCCVSIIKLALVPLLAAYLRLLTKLFYLIRPRGFLVDLLGKTSPLFMTQCTMHVKMIFPLPFSLWIRKRRLIALTGCLFLT